MIFTVLGLLFRCLHELMRGSCKELCIDQLIITEYYTISTAANNIQSAIKETWFQPIDHCLMLMDQFWF